MMQAKEMHDGSVGSHSCCFCSQAAAAAEHAWVLRPKYLAEMNQAIGAKDTCLSRRYCATACA